MVLGMSALPEVNRVIVYTGDEFNYLKAAVLECSAREHAPGQAMLGTLIKEGIKYAHLIPDFIKFVRNIFQKKKQPTG